MRLEDYLKQHKLTQREFARRIGRSRSYVSMMMRGRKVPSLRTTNLIEEETGAVASALSMLDQRGDKMGSST